MQQIYERTPIPKSDFNKVALQRIIIFKSFIKVGLSPSKNFFLICFNDSPSKMMKNAFYFILKALFVLKIFKFLSWIFVHLDKTAWLER